MNNYLASIAARTLNTASPVRPRLHGRFDPAPTASEGSINRPQLDRSRRALWRSESESEATTSQAGQDDSTNRMSRAFNVAREPEPVLPPPREVTTAVMRSVGNDAPTPQALLTNRAPSESNSLAEAERIQQHTRIEALPIRQPLDAGESLAEPIRAQLPKDNLDPRSAEPRPVPTVPHESMPAIQSLPDKRAEQTSLTPHPVATAKPVRERELQTIAIREKRLLEDSSLQRDSGIKPPAVSDVAPRSNEIQSRESKASPVTVQSRITPLTETGPERLPLRQTRAQPSPTIHVTIGRIEVRAVQQSQSPAKPRASQPVMNLDDYLRRRSQGSA